MTTPNCPVCGLPLQHDLKNGVHSLWCSKGECPSMVTNDGAEGATLEEAIEKLELMVQAEREI